MGADWRRLGRARRRAGRRYDWLARRRAGRQALRLVGKAPGRQALRLVGMAPGRQALRLVGMAPGKQALRLVGMAPRRPKTPRQITVYIGGGEGAETLPHQIEVLRAKYTTVFNCCVVIVSLLMSV